MLYYLTNNYILFTYKALFNNGFSKTGFCERGHVIWLERGQAKPDTVASILSRAGFADLGFGVWGLGSNGTKKTVKWFN